MSTDTDSTMEEENKEEIFDPPNLDLPNSDYPAFDVHFGRGGTFVKGIIRKNKSGAHRLHLDHILAPLLKDVPGDIMKLCGFLVLEDPEERRVISGGSVDIDGNYSEGESSYYPPEKVHVDAAFMFRTYERKTLLYIYETNLPRSMWVDAYKEAFPLKDPPKPPTHPGVASMVPFGSQH